MEPLEGSFVGTTSSEEDDPFPSVKERRIPICIFFRNARLILKFDELGREIAQIALPAALALTADPIASLVDTAFIGRIGPAELAAVGVSIALFNQVSRIAIFPLVSVTTSFVAEEDTIRSVSSEAQESECLEACSIENAENMELIPQNESSDHLSELIQISSFKVSKFDQMPRRRHIPSASSALVIGSVLGLLQAIFLISAAKPLLNFMGVGSDSPMLTPAQQYLTLRSLGAPAVLLSLAMQGVFRGFKDTTTPLIATVAGDVTNIILDPLFIFVFHLGVSGAAIAHVISQYVISLILLWKLMQQIDLLPPSFKHLQFGRFLKNVFCGCTRFSATNESCRRDVLCDSCRIHGGSLGADIDGRISSLLASVVGDIAPCRWACCRWTGNPGKRVCEEGLQQGQRDHIPSTPVGTASGTGASSPSRSRNAFWSKIIHNGCWCPPCNQYRNTASDQHQFIAATQPINALAFVFDGVNFGASDFAYSAYSMVAVAVVSILCLFILSSSHGFIGIWIALTIYMSLRAFAGFWRIGTGTGPWNFLWG
ncbi:protein DETOXIFICATION 42 isoform X1 [Eucalyptus grandis]|uniref:protein DETOXIFICATION 42 isoform X1 n=1 Tax=Eucalyptus grandis TaxID=71139 RepID=UPI00192EA7D7|nr:protein DETOXIFICATION 42 isoform X1 [Eucalyptus grandis]